MRIIRGKLKGRKFFPPKNFNSRPTTDFAKESLFNIIENYFDIEQIKVLDLFSGSGSISFEFLSRACISATSVDISSKNIEHINKNSIVFKTENELNTIKTDAFKYIKNSNLDYDVIFADPPYDLKNIDTIPDIIFNNETLNKNVLLIIEHSSKVNFTQHKYFDNLRKYGKVHFSFFEINTNQI